MNCSIVASNNLPGDLEWKVWQCWFSCMFNNFNSAKMYTKVHFASPKLDKRGGFELEKMSFVANDVS